MGKEYITDTVSLRGVQSLDRLTQVESKLAQITANVSLKEEEEQNLPVFSVATAGPPRLLDGNPATTVSIGSFVDSASPFQPIYIQSADTIKFYTGQAPDRSQVLFYPGAERLTISNTGRVGINSTSNLDSTLDVREGLPYRDFGIPIPPSTSTLSITQPFFKDKRGGPTEFGIIQFRLNPSEETDKPFTFSGISSGNDGITDSYEDPIANLRFYTNTGGGEGGPELVKHLEINGFENKTKIFTQLNLGNVPVFRDQEEAVQSGLVNGDVYQDREQNLKIVSLLEEGEGPVLKPRSIE
tara:strand:- start:17 stop:910 length:894 start_codon:yes stop_codon:yes gene_type:complete